MTAYLIVGCRVLLGVVFLVSAASKLRGRGAFDQFVAAVERFGLVPPARVRAVATVVVAAEAAIPLLLVVPATVSTGFGAAVVLLGGFTVAIGLALRRGVRTPCRCFGVSASPIGLRHLVRNLLLGAVAVAGLTAVLMGTTGGIHPGGVAVAATAGLTVALLVVLADDLADLFSPSTTPSATRGTD